MTSGFEHSSLTHGTSGREVTNEEVIFNLNICSKMERWTAVCWGIGDNLLAMI